MAKSVYDIIKKQNGEKFAKAIRNYDSGIFDVEDIDKIVKFAGKEAEPIMNYLISLKDVKIEEHGVHKSPFELLREAGYVSMYADTLEKQNNPDFQALYARGEEICTFRDPHRFENYHIIHCIKENINDIKREDFPNPKRQDEYGTSAISIQIAKSGGFISIKNRYNHTVSACDNTFDSNPDNIIEGLSESLKYHFGVDFSSQKVSVPEGYTLMNEQILKYNFEENDVYFGKDFYAYGGRITPIDKLREIMIDNCILDLSKKEITCPGCDDNALQEALQIEIEDKKLLVKNNEEGNKCLFADGVEILELKEGNIVSLNFPTVTELDNSFIYRNEYMKSINMPNLVMMRDGCFLDVESLVNVNLPNLKYMGSDCFRYIDSLASLNLPSLQKTGSYCFNDANSLTALEVPNLEKIGNNCFQNADSLFSVKAPNLSTMWSCCFMDVASLTLFESPNLQSMDSCCFHQASSLTLFDAPNLQSMDNSCFQNVNLLPSFYAPDLMSMGRYCFQNAEALVSLDMPVLQTIDDYCFQKISSLTSINLPNIQNLGNFCFDDVSSVTSVNMPEHLTPKNIKELNSQQKVFKALKTSAFINKQR